MLTIIFLAVAAAVVWAGLKRGKGKGRSRGKRDGAVTAQRVLRRGLQELGDALVLFTAEDEAPWRIAIGVAALAVLGVWWVHAPLEVREGVTGAALVLAAGRAGWIASKRRPFERRVYESVAAVVHLPAEAAERPRAWVRVRAWAGGHPSVVTVLYPHSYRVDSEGNGRFEEAFTARVQAPANHEWRYNWITTKSLVRISAHPPLPQLVKYSPEPDSKPLQIPLGVSDDGVVYWDLLGEASHILIGGPTGSGKSVCQRVAITHALIHAARSDAFLVYGCDPKHTELFWMKGLPGVVAVESDLAEMALLIEDVYQEMRHRQRMMEQAHANHYTKLPHHLPAILLVVDEVTEFLELGGIKTEEGVAEDEARKAAKGKIASIARLGRAMGVHLLLATQRPDATSFPGNLMNNVQARVAAGRMDSIPSSMILDSPAATQLPGIKGRGVVRMGGVLTVTQLYYLDEAEIPGLLEAVTRQDHSAADSNTGSSSNSPRHPIPALAPAGPQEVEGA